MRNRALLTIFGMLSFFLCIFCFTITAANQYTELEIDQEDYIEYNGGLYVKTENINQLLKSTTFQEDLCRNIQPVISFRDKGMVCKATKEVVVNMSFDIKADQDHFKRVERHYLLSPTEQVEYPKDFLTAEVTSYSFTSSPNLIYVEEVNKSYIESSYKEIFEKDFNEIDWEEQFKQF